ncbi:6-phosphofructo-2-kinase/fructose-2,6-bisphosphatase-like [Dendronephthya gigantea]|uniref:6-phosphofructo-2-kinase/fructose-2, 6-bisphosphatase-like n=1 Tax=Dendronephthya gigantea TaxID=151771 RepID=UPI0010696622|nr:6-phosphofructo-2-kinase/fructose-2,6-bisphosphatase-like [Dendronephthya gigantea]
MVDRLRYPASCPSRSLVNKPVCLAMVGLPARGKTFIARKLARYLNWISIETQVFSSGNYRRDLLKSQCTHEFFDPNNPKGIAIRERCAELAMNDIAIWLNGQGQVAIFDSTNGTRKRREKVINFCKQNNFKLLFIESYCDDSSIVHSNIMEVKVTSPDYKNVSPEQACEDFKARIKLYETQYEPLCSEMDNQVRFLKVVNTGKRFVVNRAEGYVESKVVYYTMNIHVTPRSIYLTRHGESGFNLKGRIGGDSELSPHGQKFAEVLGEFVNEQSLENLKVWTSQLKRTSQSAQHIKAPVEQWKALNELDAGVCDGMTYEEIQEKYPEDFARRDQDKFHYRYKRGESYEDIVIRLEPVILELERQQNVLVICHQAIMRCLLGYFLEKNKAELPYLPVPLHTVFKLTPIAYGCKVETFPLGVEAVNTQRERPKNVQVGRKPEDALVTVPPHFN